MCYPAGKANASFEIPSTVTCIGDHAFYYCVNLTNVEISNSVTDIEDYAFLSCAGLTAVTIPDGVTNIGKYAFRECTGLTSVTIGNSVTSIGTYAFYNCDSIASLTIGNSVTSIGNYAFRNCTSLTNIYSLNTTPPTCGSRVFSDTTYTAATLHVPSEAVEDYQLADTWENFTLIAGDYATGIESASISGEYAIDAVNGIISVSGIDGNVAIYGVNGAKVAEAKTDGGMAEISIPHNGVYIVRIYDGNGTVVRKVMAR